MCKRYAAFANEVHEAGGGWNDCIGMFDDLEEAKAAADAWRSGADQMAGWMQVADLLTGDLHERVRGLAWTVSDGEVKP